MASSLNEFWIYKALTWPSIVRLILTCILAYAGIMKFQSPQSMEVYVSVLAWIPNAFALFVIEILPWVEIVTAVTVWIEPIQKPVNG